MDIFTVIIWLLTVGFLIISYVKDNEKTKKALRNAVGMGKGMLKSILLVILSIGLLISIMPPQQIAGFVVKQNFIFATIVSAAFGTITLIPAFIAFPLVGTLVNAGVGIVPSVAFLTTLTMVGVITFPLEKDSFGMKFTLTRNILSFIFAIIIALAMGVII
ncbi:hypothetical protein SDC9_60608 [bioreactor metagenome]|uniref:Permease n=1 Tax=bioreactor metagenome TaxID=1076179 RepID=A0A644XEB9_9ZZZZ|nr:permease [Candidatus Metalachnospira sp.]